MAVSALFDLDSFEDWGPCVHVEPYHSLLAMYDCASMLEFASYGCSRMHQ